MHLDAVQGRVEQRSELYMNILRASSADSDDVMRQKPFAKHSPLVDVWSKVVQVWEKLQHNYACISTTGGVTIMLTHTTCSDEHINQQIANRG